MRTKTCVHKSCRSDSRYEHKDHMKDIFFIPFPKPKRNYDKCKRWIKWLGREDYSVQRVNSNTYLCSKHFVGGKGPTVMFPDPIHSQKEYVSLLKPRVRENNILDIEIHLPLPPTVNTPADKNQSHETVVSSKFSEPYSNSYKCNELLTNCTIYSEETVVQEITPEIGIKNEFILPHDNTLEHSEEISESLDAELEKSARKDTDKFDRNLIQCKDFIEIEVHWLNVRETFEKFQAPLSWATTLYENSFKVQKLNEDTGEALLGITINGDFKSEYKVNGRVLKDENILKKFPQIITTHEMLTDTLQKIKSTKLCSGSNEEEYVSIFRKYNETEGFFCNGGVHGTNCTLFISDNKNRCFYCIKKRNSLRVIASRRKRKVNKSIVPFKNLTKMELVEKLRESKSNESKLKAKLQRLRTKFERINKRKGVDLEQDELDSDILEKNVEEQSRNENGANKKMEVDV